MNRAKRTRGMTLIEMLAAITVLMILMAILAEVFLQATRAAGQGKALAEVYQVARALRTVLARDLSGATTDFLESKENGIIAPTSRIWGLPPGPYHSALSLAPTFTAADMRRMLAGGSDYLVLVSSSASSADKAVAKVFYVLRETGQLIRVAHRDTVFTNMDYAMDAFDRGTVIDDPNQMDLYEETRIIAGNVGRVKFSFLDRADGPVSQEAQVYAGGLWVNDWDWNVKQYLPSAVKVELQLVDHLWKTSDGDAISNRDFSPQQTDDNLRAGEFFDPDDGEPFMFIIDLPLAMRRTGG